MWINDGSLAKQSYAHAFAWSDESTFQKRDTSNISILRCSFHKTAKRLSITGLTHLLRLRTKIQSSIVKALIIKIPNNKKRQFRPIFVLLLPAQTPLCCWLALVIRHVILLQQKRKKKEKYEVSKKNFKTNTELSKFTDNTRLSNDDKHKKSRIGLLHKHQSPEGIQLTWTIISQIYRKKKICLQALTIQNLSLIFVIQQQCYEIAYLEDSTKSNSTLDAPKTFLNDTQHSHLINQSCLF
jgi:hypothetical protein